MLIYGDTIARIGQELRQGSKVPVRIFHMPMAQVARQDEDAIDGAFAAGQPALQHPRSHGVTKVV